MSENPSGKGPSLKKAATNHIENNEKIALTRPELASFVARGTLNLRAEIETETGLLATYDQVFAEISAEIVRRSEQAVMDAEKLATLKS